MITYIIAHLLGDWIFQPRGMAVDKGKQTWHGYMMCLAHVCIYTTCFMVLVPDQTGLFYLSIFIPHFLIDKWSLMSHWQKWRDGKFWWQSYQDKPHGWAFEFMDRVEMGFAGLRYAVEDNTAHLIFLWLSFKYLSNQ